MNQKAQPTAASEKLLKDLAESLQVPAARYQAAERSYHSVGNWLQREASSLRENDPQVYIQGSFRLGTAIRPFADDEDYDVDIVCELAITKNTHTQEQLKMALGHEIQLYADAHGLKPAASGRRCWTLQYADGAQFHLDTLPAIPDALRQRTLLENRGYSTEWSETAIAITDRDHYAYRSINDDWPHSNPKGFANWFRSTMRALFEARRSALALEAKTNVESIPEYRVRTPLQSAIQILKHHRDRMFEGRAEDKPISIIITTLSARAYQQEPTIGLALLNILALMDQFVERRNNVAWIPNPTDPAENFADRWQSHPQREKAFYDWLTQARSDFENATGAFTREEASRVLLKSLGERLVEDANAREDASKSGFISQSIQAAKKLLSPAHRQSPPWTLASEGRAFFENTTATRPGFRPEVIHSDGAPLPKGCSLQFEADTTVPRPYKVYWQIINTGIEAECANQLRGGFDEGTITSGKLSHRETTKYFGEHSIECFIVKDGLLAARSGQFLVNIQR